MADDENDCVVDFTDVLASMDEEKALVMGGIDNQVVCSFTKGYMKRQAIYTCRTCLDISQTQAGFCYQCSLNCHEGHDLVELYTKRNFRCDCGNAKFKGFCCNLWEEKDDENVNNQYNNNFSNKYCTCQRPYPDDSYEGEEEMIQCGICEDWFHIEHLNLGSDCSTPEENEEMNCFQCVLKHPFLLLYGMHTHQQPLHSTLKAFFDSHQAENSTAPITKRPKLELTNDSADGKASETCGLKQLVEDLRLNLMDVHHLRSDDLNWIDYSKVPSIFWSSGWRDRLCRCERCQAMYAEHQLTFLLDPEDTMAHYVKLGEQKALEIDKEDHDALSAALAELPHTLAINIATGVNNLKKALEEFFKRKRDENHVITEAEVRSFFEKLREQQRQL